MTESGFESRLMRMVEDVPPGHVVSYGDLARALGIVPLHVGRLMARAPEHVPWHRVVGGDGTLRLARRSPHHAALQRRLLEGEGVRFDARGRVAAEYFDET